MIRSLWSVVFIIIFNMLQSSSVAFTHSLHGMWKNPNDCVSIITIDDHTIFLRNGDANIAVDYTADGTYDNTYHLNNLRFVKFAMPSKLPGIDLRTAWGVIRKLKKYGATIKIREEECRRYHQTVVVFWTIRGDTGEFVLQRLL